MSMQLNASRDDHPETVEQRLRRVIEVHFDPDGGSAFWLDRQARLGVDARRTIRTPRDLEVLGDMVPADLAGRPLLDYIPRRFHTRLDRFILGQTGGTTGDGVWTAYREDEFHEAFVLPFLAAAAAVGFPSGENWLYVGPSGPHIIGKVARYLANGLGAGDPFSVDFDARWAKLLPENSFARGRYLQHVIEQAMAIIRRQPVGVLFTTPAVLSALAEAMTLEERARIRGVHYGGMAITPEQMQQFQTAGFPRAVHLSGYGNTLFGCCLELDVPSGRTLDYYPFGTRLLFEAIDEAGQAQPEGVPGRVRFTRLDESMLIVRMRERDETSALPAPEKRVEGFEIGGLRDPHSPRAWAPQLAVGLY